MLDMGDYKGLVCAIKTAIENTNNGRIRFCIFSALLILIGPIVFGIVLCVTLKYNVTDEVKIIAWTSFPALLTICSSSLFARLINLERKEIAARQKTIANSLEAITKHINIEEDVKKTANNSMKPQHNFPSEVRLRS